jgi:hypothetical protein
MKTRYMFLVSMFLLVTLVFRLSIAVQASPIPQFGQYETPTPGTDGRIIYIVREADSCIRISLLHNISVDLLKSLNPELDVNCTLQVGQPLLIGMGGPAVITPSPGPSPLPTEILPTPTPFTGTTEVCVLLFNDINGDALRQTTEIGIAGGAISLTNINGSYSQTQDTTDAINPDTSDPILSCFTDIPEGEYSVSIAIPDDYNPTMAVNQTLEVIAGDRAFVDFGAQSKMAQAATPTDQSGKPSALLGVLGGFLLLCGAGLGWYALRLRGPKNRINLKNLIKK